MQSLAEILKHVQFVEKYVTWRTGTAIPGEMLFLHNSLGLFIFSSPSGLDECDLKISVIPPLNYSAMRKVMPSTVYCACLKGCLRGFRDEIQTAF